MLVLLEQQGLTFMAEQAQALKAEAPAEGMFVWFPTGYGKSLCLSIAALCDGLQAR